jgi:ubiquinone/menaquinone biosynthesis C-methylase UbiE
VEHRPSSDQPQVRAFNRVDESTMQPWIIDYLERVGRRDDMRQVDTATHRMLRLAPGDHALEVAAGLGDDAIALARIVGTTGHVVGVDLSNELVSLARQRADAAGVQIEFRVGDMAALDLPDAMFHGVRIERALQYAADPGDVIRELARILRPGGHLVAAEPDWGSMSTDLEDSELVDATVTWWVHWLAGAGFHPRIGLRLARHMRRAGLVDLEVEIVPLVALSRESAGEVLPMFARETPPELAARVAEYEHLGRWRAALDEAEAGGGVVASLQIWVVGARKPV